MFGGVHIIRVCIKVVMFFEYSKLKMMLAEMMKTYWISLFSLKWNHCKKPCSTLSEREGGRGDREGERERQRRREREREREKERERERKELVLFAYS